jgi:SAM-dependent methyltransferase
MAQVTHGIRSLFSLPTFYRSVRRLMGVPYLYDALVREYVRPNPGDRILDIGCGPGDVLAHLPEGVDYHGFDMSQAYVDAARARYGSRGQFSCERVGADTPALRHGFDVVLAFGILHHLEDDEVRGLCRVAQAALRPGGRMVSMDGVYVAGQSRLARYLISKDRGQNVRTQEGYETLVRPAFAEVRGSVRHDLLRIPYTLLVMECLR